MKVFHLKYAERNRHPAVLVAMIVHGTRLTNFPTDRHQFVKRSAVDQIARVVLTIPVQVRRERIGIDRILLQETANRLSENECGLRELCSSLTSFWIETVLAEVIIDIRRVSPSKDDERCNVLKSAAEILPPECALELVGQLQVSLVLGFPARSHNLLALALRHRRVGRTFTPPQILGSSDFSNHNPAAAAAAHVIDTNTSCITSPMRLACIARGTAFPTSKLIAPATIAATVDFTHFLPCASRRVEPGRDSEAVRPEPAD